jgi:hypothetical protein
VEPPRRGGSAPNEAKKRKSHSAQAASASPRDEATDASPLDEATDASPLDEATDASPRDEATDASPRDEATDASPRDEATDASPRDETTDASPRDKAGEIEDYIVKVRSWAGFKFDVVAIFKLRAVHGLCTVVKMTLGRCTEFHTRQSRSLCSRIRYIRTFPEIS